MVRGTKQQLVGHWISLHFVCVCVYGFSSHSIHIIGVRLVIDASEPWNTMNGSSHRLIDVLNN